MADGYADLARRLDLAPDNQEVATGVAQPGQAGQNPQQGGATVMERNRIRPQVNSRSATNGGNDLNAAKRALKRDK